MKRIFYFAIILILSNTIYSSDSFYLKLSENEANQIIENGLSALLGRTPTKFRKYTYYIEDTNTNDKYWKVENLKYESIEYNIIGYLNLFYPELPRYSHDYVRQFMVFSTTDEP